MIFDLTEKNQDSLKKSESQLWLELLKNYWFVNFYQEIPSFIRDHVNFNREVNRIKLNKGNISTLGKRKISETARLRSWPSRMSHTPILNVWDFDQQYLTLRRLPINDSPIRANPDQGLPLDINVSVNHFYNVRVYDILENKKESKYE